MEIVHARCCGLDVHKKSVVACVLISQPGPGQKKRGVYKKKEGGAVGVGGGAPPGGGGPPGAFF